MYIYSLYIYLYNNMYVYTCIHTLFICIYIIYCICIIYMCIGDSLKYHYEFEFSDDTASQLIPRPSHTIEAAKQMADLGK